MNLYRKYRPAKLEDMVGNEAIVETLEGMLRNVETFPHTILFHGPTGCGKTTLAHIVANRLGCVGNDLMVLNTADVRGIDTVREIIKNSSYVAMEGVCRVWVLDEFHKATGDAQNALLNITENTPEHVYFIICTTEPQKLIAPLKGRCSQFQVGVLTDGEMQGLLRRVARREGVKLEPIVLEQIAQDSLGLPRNALTVLEQVLGVAPEHRLEIAKQTAAQQSQTIELCRALLRKAGWKELRGILAGLQGEEPEAIRRSIMGYMNVVLLKEDNDRAGLVLEMMMELSYNSGIAGITYASYIITKKGD